MKNWYKEGFVYQIYPTSFKDSNGDGIGDLRGIIEKIPYIKSLGVDIVWLSPIYTSPMNDNGYDIADYRNINSIFGTMNDFDEMIEKFHREGIRVVMDLVVNHTSSEHYWFKEALKSKENPYHDYYFFRDKPNNWTSFFEGSAWEYVKELDQYYLHLFDKSQPDLNWENPKVREEVKDILRFWLDKGVDGFRCDVLNLISKRSGLPDGRESIFLTGIEHYANGPRLHEYLRELNDDVFSKYDCFTVGECGGLNPEIAMDFIGDDRHELNMVFQFDHFGLDGDGVKWRYKPFTFKDLKKSFNKWQYAFNDVPGWNTLVLENHDQPRSTSRYCDLNFRKKSSTLLAMYAFLLSGTPYLYQGEEIGMTNCKFESLDEFRDVESLNIYQTGINQYHLSHEEMMKNLNYIGRDNARTPMQWNNSLNAGFSDGKPWIKVNPNYQEINVETDLSSEDSMIEFYKKLICVKKNSNTLIYGKYFDFCEESDIIILYKRYDDEFEYYIVGNNSPIERRIELPFVNGKLVLNNYDIDEEVFKPYQGKVYKVEKCK